jgi:hypothetical protein
VVPVLLDGARMPAAHDLPDSIGPLADRHAIAVTGERLSSEIDELVNSIQKGRIRALYWSEHPA